MPFFTSSSQGALHTHSFSSYNVNVGNLCSDIMMKVFFLDSDTSLSQRRSVFSADKEMDLIVIIISLTLTALKIGPMPFLQSVELTEGEFLL